MSDNKRSETPLREENIYSQIHLIRKHKVMLSTDLALLYEVDAKVLNQAVKRNLHRFPEDFMFQVTEQEWSSLRSQIVTLDGRGKFPKYLPYAFTEQGVSMLSSVLNSPRAIAVNIQIMRLFVKMRQMVFEYAEMDNNLDIAAIYKLIKELLEPSIKNRQPVGFKISQGG